MQTVTTKPLLLMKSSDDFTHHSAEEIQIPDFESDPFRLIANAEDHLVNHYHFNLQGIDIMSNKTQLAQALTEAGVTHTRHAYFDLLEFIEENITHEQAKASLTSSLAWMVDMMAVNASRAMFFRSYQDSDGDGTRDAYSAFIDEFLNNIEMMNEGEFGEGASRDLVQLLAFSGNMHDMAYKASAAILRDYNPRSHDELLRNEKPRDPDALTMAKLIQLAKFVNDDGDEASEKAILDGIVEREKANAKGRHDNNVKINPIVMGLLDVAKRHAPDSIEFYELDKALQLRLITSAKSMFTNAVSRLAGYKSISTLEFAMLLKESKVIGKKFDEIMATYRTPEEDAVIRAQQRATKAAGKKSDSSDFEADEAEAARKLNAANTQVNVDA